MVVKPTVSVVAVEAVTVPMALLLNSTRLREAVRSKPNPLMTRLDASAARSAVLTVATGVTVATCTAAPLL